MSRHPVEGCVEAVILRPARKVDAIGVEQALAIPGRGLEGDRYAQGERAGSVPRARQMTIVQAEHLPLVAAWTGHSAIDPRWLRRNLVVSGINLLSMRSPFPELKFLWRIGTEAIIEVSGPCDPCSRMESMLGDGGYNALRGHGGLTARILVGGLIRVGDRVTIETATQPESAAGTEKDKPYSKPGAPG